MSKCSKVLVIFFTLIAMVLVITFTKFSSKSSSDLEDRSSDSVKVSTKDLYYDFTHNSIVLPFPSATLPVTELLQQKWVKDLRQILLNFPQKSTPVFTVTCNYNYRDVLLNWLIAAKTQIDPPLSHVIIFSLDKDLCELLASRSILCVFVNPKSFIKRKLLLEDVEVFYQILVLRITAIRLINHWGYDAANVDTDAVVLRNPEVLFSSAKYKDSDIIASSGKFPFNLKVKWGVTMCGGFFLIKSSAASENFWNVMSHVLPKTLNDQVKLNNALDAMHPNWGNTADKDILYNEKEATTPDGFKVTILPSTYVCRQTCDIQKKEQYYVWHRGGSRSTEGKMEYAKRGRLWFLRMDWENRSSSCFKKGEEWLREIAQV